MTHRSEIVLRYAERNLAAGLCARCPNWRENQAIRNCNACRAKRTAYGQRWRARRREQAALAKEAAE